MLEWAASIRVRTGGQASNHRCEAGFRKKYEQTNAMYGTCDLLEGKKDGHDSPQDPIPSSVPPFWLRLSLVERGEYGREPFTHVSDFMYQKTWSYRAAEKLKVWAPCALSGTHFFCRFFPIVRPHADDRLLRFQRRHREEVQCTGELRLRRHRTLPV